MGWGEPCCVLFKGCCVLFKGRVEIGETCWHLCCELACLKHAVPLCSISPSPVNALRGAVGPPRGRRGAARLGAAAGPPWGRRGAAGDRRGGAGGKPVQSAKASTTLKPIEFLHTTLLIKNKTFPWDIGIYRKLYRKIYRNNIRNHIGNDIEIEWE